MNKVKKMIVIENCLQCPKWLKCKPSKSFTSKQRFTLTFGIGIDKFILKECPLKDVPGE